MTEEEKKEIEKLPEKYRPLGAWGYLGYTILFSIPLLGQICVILFALDGSNVARRSYARSFLLIPLIWAVILLVISMYTTSWFY